MRWKLLSVLVAVIGLLQVASFAPGAVAAGPIITDPAGDATDFVLATGAPSAASEPSLDILSGDIAVTADTLTTTVTVDDLKAEPPPGGTGRVFRFYFSYAALEFSTRATSAIDGTATFRLYDPSNTGVPCTGCTGSFDVAADTVSVSVPMTVLNGAIAALSAPPIGAGAELSGLEILAQRSVSAPAAGGATPTADTATTATKYVVTGGTTPPPPPPAPPINPDEIGDATVIAVIDSNLQPYHFDFTAAHMPQHQNGDPADDLPLTAAPHTWLPGFPAPTSFSSYDSLPLTLPTAASDDPVAMSNADAAKWATVPQSAAGSVHYRWIPGSKVIGTIDFGGSTGRGLPDGHGTGVTSVSVGNLHGTCPECLLVFINTATPSEELPIPDVPQDRSRVEEAILWAANQPWIDIVTNSYGINQVGGAVRDNVYGGRKTVEPGRVATDRGQTIFFSAGNGIENGFVVPNVTYTSSVKGPDWIMTVGAITPPPADSNYIGAGKPVDLSSIGTGYPSAYTATTAGGTGETGFSGTSNATPTVAGLYGRALHEARSALAGPSRGQAGGVIATGGGVTCGAERAACELGDGVLTAQELRNRLLLGAKPTTGGSNVLDLEDVPRNADERFASEGHGAYKGRVSGLDAAWLAEHERIAGPLFGRAAEMERPVGEVEWMTADSFCRQHLWGSWAGGYYRDANSTPLPPADTAFLTRSVIAASCPALFVPPTP